ncbi:hypothetical protein LEMLEM_LOCUS9079 [Lemmus lemmus]
MVFLAIVSELPKGWALYSAASPYPSSALHFTLCQDHMVFPEPAFLCITGPIPGTPSGWADI